MWETTYVFKPKPAAVMGLARKLNEANERIRKLIDEGWEPFGITTTGYGERWQFKRLSNGEAHDNIINYKHNN